MKIFSQSYKSGGCEMEFFNFLWLILDNYLTKVPTLLFFAGAFGG